MKKAFGNLAFIPFDPKILLCLQNIGKLTVKNSTLDSPLYVTSEFLIELVGNSI